MLVNKYKWCCIDCETEGQEAKLLGVAFYSDDIQEYVTDIHKIRDYLFFHAENGYTFLAHNAAYDVPIIFRACNIDVTIVVYNHRFNRADWKYHPRKAMAQVWDSLGLSGGLSLKKLGEAMQLPKYDTPQVLQGKDPDKYKWKCDKHEVWECIECYCLRDSEIPYRFMQDFTELLNGWGLEPKRRIAGISVEAWKLFDAPDPIFLRDNRMKELGRLAYHGGRVETYKLGHVSPAYCADVCSMYPSVMLETPQPDTLSMYYLWNITPDRVNWDDEGVAEVEITVPQMYIPPLPYNDGDRRTYPCGTLRGCWPLLEIRYALSLGCEIRNVYRIAASPTKIYPFSNFVNTLWTLREEYESKSDPRTLLAKLIMNNLYGRIGMKEELTMVKQYPMPKIKSMLELQGLTQYEIGGHNFVEEEKVQRFRNKWANVIWAAQITAAARVKLHKLMMLQGSHMVYCDTDSIFSMQPIQGMGEGLGQLRNEEVLTELYVIQPKTYAYSDLLGTWSYKAKGVPKAKAKQYIEEGIVYFESPIRPMEQKRRNRLAGEWIECKRENHHAPHRRNPLVPVSTLGEYEWTDTVAPIVE